MDQSPFPVVTNYNNRTGDLYFSFGTTQRFDHVLFIRLAPYVKNDSFIELDLECETYRLVFQEGTLYRVSPKRRAIDEQPLIY